MGDLIDRKAILKHIEKIRQDALTMDDIRRASIIMNGMDLCEKAVRNQPSAQPDNQINLCDSCDYSYPDCPAKNDDVIFGNGIGNDNICACNKYKPFAQSEPKWIPCSERLPEDLEEVNVTWVNHDPEPYYDFVKDKPFTATAVYYKEKWYWSSSTCADMLAEYGRNANEEIDDGIEIIAWMPLPEPYRRGGEDE